MIPSNHQETARANGVAPAAPPGGAQCIGGRGCGLEGFVSLILPTVVSLAIGLAAAVPLRADEGGLDADLAGAFIPVPVPSGQRVLLSEVLLDETPGALWARFRFVAPEISRQEVGADPALQQASFERSASDMEHLCGTLAVDYLRHHALSPRMVVISFSDRPVEFGQQDVDATQFFEAFRLTDGRCIWEGF